MKSLGRVSRLPLASVDPHEAFLDFEQILVSNSGEDAFDVALRLLATKLLDEIKARTDGCPRRFALEGSPDEVSQRINSLYREVRRLWPELNGHEKGIGLPPAHLVRCLQPLLGWDILDSDLSHLDAALERLVARDSKGALGQYFTPRDVVRLCIEVLDPSPTDKVIDPACGSGGFLYEAVRHCLQKHHMPPQCLGIDLGAKAIKVGQLLSRATGGKAIQVTRGNSLDGREYSNSHPAEWENFCERTAREQKRQVWGAWDQLRCNVLFTNPPFAGQIDDPEVLAHFDLLRDRDATRKGSISREHLFLMRAVNMLAPGGRLAIVLPQGVLANATSAYLRRWVLKNCKVLAVVGLHPFSFLPYTTVKTSLLFLEKPDKGQSASDSPILFQVSRKPGRDNRGRLVGESDLQDIAMVLRRFVCKLGRPWATATSGEVGQINSETRGRYNGEVPTSEVIHHDRLDAEYFDESVRNTHAALTERASRRVGDVVARSIARFKRRGSDEIDYLDISSVDNRTGMLLPTVVSADEAPSRASYIVQVGDVLVSTVRPERNTVGLITKTRSRPTVASNGFCVLRPTGIAPEVLFAYCKTKAFRDLLARRCTASMYPTATDRDVLDIPLVDIPSKIQESVTERLKAGLNLLDEGQTSIQSAIAEMQEGLKTQSEDTSKQSGRSAHEPILRPLQGPMADPQPSLPTLGDAGRQSGQETPLRRRRRHR